MNQDAQSLVSGLSVLFSWLVQTLNVFAKLNLSGFLILLLLMATVFYYFRDVIVPAMLEVWKEMRR